MQRSSVAERPNVLFIAVDDLNDWVGVLGGHPNASTPNLDRLAARGVCFTNAHCSAPICSASRTSVLSGREPYNSGVYTNAQQFRDYLPDAVSIPQHFMRSGYEVLGAGKMFHSPEPSSFHEEFLIEQKALGSFRSPDDGWGLAGRPGFNWGPVDIDEEELHDRQLARWVESVLARSFDAPFFVSVGLALPHLPWWVPSDYLERFPPDEISLPLLYYADRADIPGRAKELAHFSFRARLVREAGQDTKAVAAYLAATAFMDDALGIILDALDASPFADNTVIVLWSDHGHHLGEKGHWSKYVLWEDSTRVPLAVVAPGVTQPGQLCSRPVSLVHLYRTLIDLCGLPEVAEIDGVSLRPLLADPQAAWELPALSMVDVNVAVRTERWRYIRYATGGAELYDHNDDEHEWLNLLWGNQDRRELVAELEKWMPESFVPISQGGSGLEEPVSDI